MRATGRVVASPPRGNPRWTGSPVCEWTSELAKAEDDPTAAMLVKF